jgi:hypothetical protein
VVGAKAGRRCSRVTTTKSSGRWSSEGVDGVPVARVLEGGEEVARELLWVNVVLPVLLAGVKRFWIGGSTARPSDGGAKISSALRSGCSDARGRVWMGWGAPAGDGDAVCALDRRWGAVVVAVDDC